MGLLTPLSLIVTDLDNTLVGDDEALLQLNELLDRYRQTSATKIVYATGRSFTSYQELATTHRLLPPDALIAAVGTEIYIGESSEPDIAWEQQLSQNWYREKVLFIADRFADLKPQSQPEQRPFKVSYHLSPNVAPPVIIELQQLIDREDLNVELIYSGSKDLDIIPQGGNKGKAVQFLRLRWGIDPTNTVVCGDSGNDTSLFQYGIERGIIVGNARSELRLWHQLHPADYHYLAVSECAAGIIEGLKYFRFVT
jgi:sucrose-6-phosphatase